MNADKVKLGIAPIAWTNDDMPELGGENTFEQCISEMALAGFTGCEVGIKYPANPAELKEALDLRGLVVCNQWYSTEFITRPHAEIEREFREKLKFLRIVGANCIGPSEQTRSCQGRKDIGVRAGKPVFSNQEWKLMIEGFDRIGRVAKEEGVKVCMHPHMGTGIQTPEEIERFLNDTHPDHVCITFDSGHLSYNGSDPLVQLRRFESRVGHIHLKDTRPEVQAVAVREDWPFLQAIREGIFTVPGDGSIDFKSIFKLLEELDYRGWMVVEAEQDPAKANPFKCAVKARKYIRTHIGL